ncbi:hypothetical protein [Sporosarcina sp. YIM B06819]|uniref:hypothetical protein n=1 Tax=Sporosarcina sp. YIM B06819 TaxID=3081769 RepID=UPI00298D3049|nr:hypothetical protein [Sporosarcina sp. YIM B06819]
MFEEIINSMRINKHQNKLIENEIDSFINVLTEISSASSQVATIADGLNQLTQQLN